MVHCEHRFTDLISSINRKLLRTETMSSPLIVSSLLNSLTLSRCSTNSCECTDFFFLFTLSSICYLFFFLLLLHISFFSIIIIIIPVSPSSFILFPMTKIPSMYYYSSIVGTQVSCRDTHCLVDLWYFSFESPDLLSLPQSYPMMHFLGLH